MGEYLVTCTALGGPPNTIRVFYEGEVVCEEDFARPAFIDRLKARGALVACPKEQVDVAQRLRAERDIQEFGFVAGTDPELVRRVVADHRAQIRQPAPQPVMMVAAPPAAPEKPAAESKGKK